MTRKKTTILVSLSVFLTIIFIIGFGSVQSEEAASGKKIFTEQRCNQCHAIESEGIEAKIPDKYPDLSSLKGDYTAGQLKGFLMKEEKINNKKHLMKFGGTDAELDALVKWLLKINS